MLPAAIAISSVVLLAVVQWLRTRPVYKKFTGGMQAAAEKPRGLAWATRLGDAMRCDDCRTP